MCRAWCVMALVTMCVGVAHCWDIAVSVKDQLIFYTNGTKTKTVNLISQNPNALVYDEVHNVMLYVDKQNNNDAVCGYYISSKDNKCFIKRNGRDIHGLAFDPVTELIFFTDTIEKSINFISLKPGCNNNIYGNLLIKMNDGTPADIAVDSCRGHIHWFSKITPNTDWKWERAQFNGSERKVILTRYNYKKFRSVLDPQTQKIFNFEFYVSTVGWPGGLYKNDLNAGNEAKLAGGLYGTSSLSSVLTISKDYIYWLNSSKSYDSIWQLPKNAGNVIAPKEIIYFYYERLLGMTARYKIEDQFKGIQDCDSMSSWIPANNTRETYDGSVCDNYCFQGDCSVSDEGLPKCRCNTGYAGQRCEVNACFNYCLNEGICSLNEEDEPVCQCVGNSEGSRCEADINDTTPMFDSAKRNLTLNDLLSTWRKPSSKMFLTVEV